MEIEGKYREMLAQSAGKGASSWLAAAAERAAAAREVQLQREAALAEGQALQAHAMSMSMGASAALHPVLQQQHHQQYQQYQQHAGQALLQRLQASRAAALAAFGPAVPSLYVAQPQLAQQPQSQTPCVAAPPQQGGATPTLPVGWHKLWDPTRKAYYYANPTTGSTSWTVPALS